MSEGQQASETSLLNRYLLRVRKAIDCTSVFVRVSFKDGLMSSTIWNLQQLYRHFNVLHISIVFAIITKVRSDPLSLPDESLMSCTADRA